MIVIYYSSVGRRVMDLINSGVPNINRIEVTKRELIDLKNDFGADFQRQVGGTYRLAHLIFKEEN